MDTNTTVLQRMEDDRVSDVLKWVLLAIAIITFALLGWATEITYQTAPPEPGRFISADGTVLMTGSDIENGKASFQRSALTRRAKLRDW